MGPAGLGRAGGGGWITRRRTIAGSAELVAELVGTVALPPHQIPPRRTKIRRAAMPIAVPATKNLYQYA